jgi:hypothetical protein
MAMGQTSRRVLFALAGLAALALAAPAWAAGGGETPRDIAYTPHPPAPKSQLPEQAAAKSAGCLTCHTETDQPTMHASPGVILGCTDCHGGDAGVFYRPPADETAAKTRAHVLPRYPETWHWPHAANPKQSYTLLNKEAPEYIRFVNPSDLRIAREACGACHLPLVQAVERSLMSTGAMLWGGAAYNNGILPFKNYVIGEAYTREGEAATLVNPVEPTEAMKKRGVLPRLLPLPAWEVLPPADVFRVFERGGRNILNLFPEIGLPNALGQLQRLEEPGRPDIRQSNRGPATGLRIAVPVINITKTRLNDPFLWFLGTNDQPGDYRTSGCGSCHVVYANDRDPRHSGPYAQYGHTGQTQTKDPTIPKDASGHPLKHSFTNAIPTSQCMICHMHQPNVFVNSYLGYTMWDYESDAPAMWPEEQRYPTHAEMYEILKRNPEEAAIRGKWSDVEFLKQVSEMNPDLNNTQFADYHGHGWNFRAIFKKDRKGNLLDAEGKIVEPDDPEKFDKAVHMSSIHLDAGMHCVDCHFAQDTHGNGHIYGEVQAAIEIRCVDCHGSYDSHPTLLTSGPAAPPGGNDLALLRVADGRSRFQWRGTECGLPVDADRDCKLYQRAALDPALEWEVSLTRDSVTPGHPGYNAKAARAKLMAKGGAAGGVDMKWGPGVRPEDRAHKEEEMECFTCHLAWTTSCAGCHLPIQANWKTERHKYEGGETRNFATYNPQVVRDQMFQLGIHGDVKNNTIAPVRSSSALVLSSQNINRERIYISQPPIAASGYSSQAFAPHFAHTVRKTETKTCTDCHLSADNDNNAIMAQLLLHGTNFVNFVGPIAYAGLDGAVEGVRVAEYDEPQAVIGSYLQRYAYPDWWREHQERGRVLPESYANRQGGATGCIQVRGEYLYAAQGTGGTQVYDVASIANKGISQRIITAPFSPFGHDTHIASKNATCVVLPTNQPVHPPQNEGDLMRQDNREQPFHPVYSYGFITDAEEGLIATNVETLKDGEPRNNYLERALTWNPDGLLHGARHLTIAGSVFYVATPRGIVVLDMDDPLAPRHLATIDLPGARASAVQFRYLFVAGAGGLQTVDVTDPARPRIVPGAAVSLAEANRVYVARTYAYVAAGRQGLAIIDVEKPEAPRLYQTYDAGGAIDDARDVVVASTNASLFAYVADGRNGLRVIQLTAPDTQPRFYGFSPEPKPELIATRPTVAPALSLSKGLDRDRGVDETGHQIAIFGRLGSRPFNLKEQQELYLDDNGRPWFTTDDVRLQDFIRATPPDRRAERAN